MFTLNTYILSDVRILTYSNVCSRMLTYDDVCRAQQTQMLSSYGQSAPSSASSSPSLTPQKLPLRYANPALV
jgi:hypothetical protein